MCLDYPSDGKCSVGIRQGSSGSQTLSSALADEGVLGFFCRLTEPVQLEGKALLAGTSLTTPHPFLSLLLATGKMRSFPSSSRI